jgi:tRNA(adenine34) deaminase
VLRDKKVFSLFMQSALDLADLAFRDGEVPVGAVVVDDAGSVIGKGFNRIESEGCQAAHAELLAIKQACAARGGWRLDGCYVFVTLEPCLMCFGLIKNSRVSGLVFGASSTLFGFSQFYVEKAVENGKDSLFLENLQEQRAIAILRAFFHRARAKKAELREGKAMSKKSLLFTKIKDSLLLRKKELLGHLHLDSEDVSGSCVKDVGDEAIDRSIEKMRSVIGAAEVDEVKEIDCALERIGSGEYGKCVSCQDAISDARLDFYNCALRCIVCQEEYESRK